MKTVDTSAFEYKDMFGTDIKVGDYIVYAGLADRSGVLRAGQVAALTHSKPAYEGDKVIPKIRAKSWNYYQSQGWSGTQSGRQKDVSLGFFERLIVVHESQVSEQIKNDLAD